MSRNCKPNLQQWRPEKTCTPTLPPAATQAEKRLQEKAATRERQREIRIKEMHKFGAICI